MGQALSLAPFSAELGPHNALPGARGHTIRSQQALITSASHHHRAPHVQGCLPRALLTCHTWPHTIHRAPTGPLFKKEGMLLRPVAKLYGQVRTDWNQRFVIIVMARWAIRLDTNRSHVHTAFYVTRDSIFTPFVECIFLLALLCMYLRSRGTYLISLLDLFSSVMAWASCRLPDPLTVFCDMFAAVLSSKTSRCLC